MKTKRPREILIGEVRTGFQIGNAIEVMTGVLDPAATTDASGDPGEWFIEKAAYEKTIDALKILKMLAKDSIREDQVSIRFIESTLRELGEL